MGAIRKTLKYLFVSFATLLLLLVLFLALAWVKPGLILNEENARRALGWAPKGMKADWESLSFAFSWESLLEKRVEFAAKGFCLDYPNTIHTCLSSLRVDLLFSLENFTPAVKKVFELQADVTMLRLPAGAETEEPAGPLPDLRFPAFGSLVPIPVDLSAIEKIQLHLREIRLESPGGPPLRISATLEGEPDGTDGMLAFGATLRQNPDLDLLYEGGISFLGPEPALKLEGKLEGEAAGSKLASPVSLSWGKSLELEADPRIRIEGDSYKAPLSLRWGNRSLELSLGDVKVRGPLGKARISLSGCRLQSELDRKEGYPASNDFQCRFKVRPDNKMIPTLRGRLDTNLTLTPLSKDSVRARIELQESGKDSFLETTITGSGEAKINVASGALEEPSLQLQARIGIPEFQAWREFWKGSALAIPAPLNNLSGPIRTELSLNSVSDDLMKGDFQLSSDLKGPGQSLALRGNADIQALRPLEKGASYKVDSRLVLKDVMLEAPPLSLTETPQLLPDDRFVLAESGRSELPPEQAPVPAADSPLEWNLKITNERPVRISTNLLDQPIPVALNLGLGSSQTINGYAEVQPMPVEVFEKNAEVQRIRVSWEEGTDVGQLNGLILHRTPEVTIRILLLGSTESPRVELQSEPPLSQDQILSVLLFNKSLAELSEEEAESTQSLGQALSQGAFGLFSLFFLASTPIESVGYDPVTQSYTARVSLGDRTTVSVGSDFEQNRRFGMRRRLGGRWALSTELRQEENAPDEVLTLIEWFRRF